MTEPSIIETDDATAVDVDAGAVVEVSEVTNRVEVVNQPPSVVEITAAMVVEVRDDRVEVIEVGVQGPPGPPGPPGSLGVPSYTYEQVDPMSAWVIDHGLSWRPDVDLVQPDGTEFYGMVVHEAPGRTVIRLGVAATGFAYLR